MRIAADVVAPPGDTAEHPPLLFPPDPPVLVVVPPPLPPPPAGAPATSASAAELMRESEPAKIHAPSFIDILLRASRADKGIARGDSCQVGPGSLALSTPAW